MTLQNPLGLALDQSVLSSGAPVLRETREIRVESGKLGQDSDAQPHDQDEPRRDYQDDEAGLTDPSRSPSPALTVSNG